MVILPHIAFVCFSYLFNNVEEKVWPKKVRNPINLSAKESDWEGFVKRL